MPKYSRTKLLMALSLSTVLTLGVLPGPAMASGQASATQTVTSVAATQNLAPAGSPSVSVSAARKLDRNPNHLDVFVNKNYPLKPAKYKPKTSTVSGTGIKLRPEATKAYNKMVKAAKKSGVRIKLISGYRSYDRQAQLFNQYTRWYGKKYAERISAKPGTSEHQTGLAADVGNNNGACALQSCFENTPVGKWMKKNAHKHGFILRYPKGQESVTGYAYEPWHFRYVGTALAKSYTNSGAKTFEHYHGVASTKKNAPKSGKGTAKTTANLNMRTGVGSSNRVILTIPRGKTVKLTGSKKSGWYQVSYKSKTGWVSGTYLSNVSMPKTSKPKTETKKKPTPQKNTGSTKKTTANLNMRSGAGTNNRVILTIPKGKSVKATGKSKSGWLQVTYKSKTGWVSGTYLTNTSTPKKSKPKTESTPKKKVQTKYTTANLNMRAGNSTNKKIILTIPKGKKVEITGSKKSGWYPVKYKSKKGWVSGTYLR
ncbi:D-alanyl-D-alanine carboxypeptidase family protein [Glutamicibacter arilaitensis]|uniref:D-alanyl-D-alanine carboxypeptidase family protein n=1 Tax=Glutamicibacter arilaitensis TaxID=256701 RepID=UPI00384B9E75